MTRLLACIALLTFTPLASAGDDVDVDAVLSARQRLVQSIAFMQKYPKTFPSKKMSKAPLLTREQHMICWEIWQTFMDRMVSLDRQEDRCRKSCKEMSTDTSRSEELIPDAGKGMLLTCNEQQHISCFSRQYLEYKRLNAQHQRCDLYQPGAKAPENLDDRIMSPVGAIYLNLFSKENGILLTGKWVRID